MQKHVIIVAGGVGTRMGSHVPKQFLELDRVPILMQTMNRFYAIDSTLDMVVVLPESYIAHWELLKKQYEFTIPHRIAVGGKQRYFSVKNGLQLIDNDGFVAIHDAVRPVLALGFLQSLFDEAQRFGNAIPYIEVKDTLRKIVKGGQSKWVNREKYKQIQTPQIFETKALKEAYNQPYKSSFTDDASLYDALGWPLHLVYGNAYNVKITTPDDLLVAEVYWKRLKEIESL